MPKDDLAGKNLDSASLSGDDMSESNLSNTSLRYSQLKGTRLHNADLSDSDMHGANLRRADVAGADLTNADLSDADVQGVDLGSAASLRGTNLDGARGVTGDLNPRMREEQALEPPVSGAPLMAAALEPLIARIEALERRVDELTGEAGTTVAEEYDSGEA